MDYKILLADDSPTIQKVVKITLANEPYQIEECPEAAELEKKLGEVKPHIVLLDFNLSEDKTGYQLAQKIYEQSPQTKIMMLFGTFDTIDDDQLKANHVAAKIIKPFDGTKFINTCRSLIEDLADNNDTLIPTGFEKEDDIPSQIEEPEALENDDEWVVNQPDIIEEEEESLPPANKKELSALEKEAQDWGMGVPGVIGETSESKDHIDIPDIIGELASEEKEEVSSETQLPQDADLDYPDVIEIAEKVDAEYFEMDEEVDSDEPLISFEDIQEAENTNGTTAIEDIEKIQAQIADEVEEEDLWSADEVEEKFDSAKEDFPEKTYDTTLEEEIFEEEVFDKDDDDYDLDKTLEEQMDDDFPEIIPHKLEAVKNDYMPPKEELPEDIAERIMEKIQPLIEEEIRKYCKEAVEKIAWEVIPDLAENLIKKQIEKITDEVLKSD